MKTRIITILCLAATCPAFTALADLEQRDSSQFAYKYEMIALPTAEDLDGTGANDLTAGNNTSWLTLGTGANVGTASMNITGSENIKSDAAVGTAGDGWRKLNATTAEEGGTGYTVEVRLKVTESTGSKGALVLNASTGDSGVNSWLVFKSGKLAWGHNKNVADIADIDGDWHTYRIVREHGTTVHSVWMDGNLVGSNLSSGIDASINRVLLGAANADYVGKAQVAWLRFDKGAYAPVDEKAYVKTNRLHSDEFNVKYEMNDGDTLVPLSGTSSDWKTGGSGATISKANGVLSVTTATKSAYWDTTDTAWKNHVTAATPFTTEFRVKINTSTQAGADRAFNFLVGTPGPLGQIFVGTNSVQWCLSTSGNGTYLTLDTSDNTDKMHKFRIAYDGATRHGFTVWRDGVVIGKNLVDCTNFYNYSGNALGIVRFGKAGGLNDGAWNLDYVRWKIGGVYPPDNRKGMFVILR